MSQPNLPPMHNGLSICPEKVAVIIAAFNASASIARAVRSALAEPQAAEIIVVDDASGDDTVRIAREQDDGSQRLKVVIQPYNQGPSAARNRAIAESSAPWIGILDADDFFLPGRLQGLLAYAGEADLIADDVWQADERDMDGPRRSLWSAALPLPAVIDFSRFVLSNVTRRGRTRGELGFIKPLMRRAFLAMHALSYQEHMRLGEDFELYSRALGHGARLLMVPAQWYVSVRRKSSLSGQHTESDLLHLRDCGEKLQRDLSLTPRQTKALRRHYLSVDCRYQWRKLITAVKERNFKNAVCAFYRPFPVPAYLAEQLARQLFLRLFTSRAHRERDGAV